MTAPTEIQTAPAPMENTDDSAQVNSNASADSIASIKGGSNSGGLSALELLAQHAHELSTLESATDTNTKLAAIKQTKKQHPVPVFSRAKRAYPDTPPTELPQLFPITQTQPLPSQRLEIIIPSHSTWFSFDSIHPVEKNSLPEYFNGLHPSKTSAIYKHHRNFMVNCFRLNPGEYLGITACRRNLVGDVAGIIRIHGFLEQWGLINFQIEPDTRPSQVGPTLRSHLTAHSSKPSGTVAAAVPDTRNATRLSAENNGSIIPQTQAPKTETKQSLTFLQSLRKSPKKSHHDMSVTRLRARLLAMQEQRVQRYRRAPLVICSSCGALCGRSTSNSNNNNDCTAEPVTLSLSTTNIEPSQTQDKTKAASAATVVSKTAATAAPVTRWHCIRNVGLDICSGCFDDGRFPSNFLSCDFVKLGLGAAPEEIALRVLSKLAAAVAAGQHVSLETLMVEETGGQDGADLRDLYAFLKHENDDFNDAIGGSGGAKGGVGTLSALLPWTHEETFLLLEGVEHFDEDWGKIAFHVGTRGKDECVERFLAVPIEEPYLTEAHATPAVLAFRRVADKLKSENNARIGVSRDGSSGPSASVWPVSVFEKLPSTPVEDPVMALAALLASAVDENVARAVADAAIHAAAPVTNLKERGRSGSLGNAFHAKKNPLIPLASPTKSPKSNSVKVNLDVLAAELHIKKFGLILNRYEEKLSRVENERCQIDADRRIHMSDAVMHRKEVREMRKKQKVELPEGGGNDSYSEKIQFGCMEVESELDEKSEQNDEEKADAQSLLDEATQENAGLEDALREDEEDNVSDNEEQDNNSRDEADLFGSGSNDYSVNMNLDQN